MPATPQRFNAEIISRPAVGSWTESIATMLPFLIYGASNVLWRVALPDGSGRAVLPVEPFFVNLAAYFLLLIGFGVGWVKGFPRWAFGYLGLLIVLTLWWMGMPTQGLWRYGIHFSDRLNDLLEWRAWIPFGVVMVLTVLLTRSLRPLGQFVGGIWNDWTRLSLVLYAFVAWLVQIYDEVHHPYLNVFIAATALVMALGAGAYARIGGTWQRVAMLLLTLPVVGTIEAVCWATGASYSTMFRPMPNSWQPNLILRTMLVGVMSTIIMYSPALLNLLSRASRIRITNG